MRTLPFRFKVTECLVSSTLLLAATTQSLGQDVPRSPTGATTRTVGPRVITSTPGATPSAPRSGVIYPPCYIPKDLHDKPYDRYVDLLLLGEAWDYHDAAWIADIGLQMAEGERILMRPHKALGSAKLLEVAAHIAGDQADNETLDRLSKVAEARKDKRLAAAIKDAREVASSASAGVHHRLGDAVEELSPRALTMHQAAIRKIRALRLAGDREKLDSLDKHLDTVDAFHEGQQAHLDHEIAKARKNIVDDGSLKATIEILDRLGALTPCSKID